MKDMIMFISDFFKSYPSLKVICIALAIMITLFLTLKLGEGIGRMIYNIWG